MSEVKLTQEEYNKMLRKIEKLHALEAWGVDKWELYGEALKVWFTENKVDEALDNFIHGIYNDVLLDAKVSEPAGRGCGYSITLDEVTLKGYALALCKQYLKIQNDK